MGEKEQSITTEVLLGSDLMEYASDLISVRYKGDSIYASRGNKDTYSLFSIDYHVQVGRDLNWAIKFIEKLYIPSEELYLHNAIVLGVSGGIRMWGIVINREQLESIISFSRYPIVLKESLLVTVNTILIKDVLKISFTRKSMVGLAGNRNQGVR
jgi:hypothetical protein